MTTCGLTASAGLATVVSTLEIQPRWTLRLLVFLVSPACRAFPQLADTIAGWVLDTRPGLFFDATIDGVPWRL